MIAKASQQSNGETADTAVGTCNQHLAVFRTQAVTLKRKHAQHRGIAGRTDGHRLACVQSVRQRDQPFALQPGALSQAAPVLFAHAPAIE